jgi:hypothetical protein
MSGFVYFVQHGETGPIKIGFTKCNVGGRYTQLQAAAPDKLVFRGYMRGSLELEAELHHRFADSRHRAEWFKPTPELQDFIAVNSIATDIDVVLRRDLRDATNLKSRAKWPKEAKRQFDRHVGEHPRRVSAWREGAAVPTERMVRYIEGFLDDHRLWPQQDQEAA